MVFTVLAFAQVGQALATRSNHASLFAIGLRSNPLMLLMVAAVLLLQLLVIYFPPMQSFFNATPLTSLDLGITLAIGALVFIVIETQKKLFPIKANAKRV